MVFNMNEMDVKSNDSSILADSGKFIANPIGIRLSKFIADSGYCSRRKAEDLIISGDVAVNGKVVLDLSTKIVDQTVKIFGKMLHCEQKHVRLWLMHKPAGYVVSDCDTQDRPLLKDLLPKGAPRLITIGRLDINSEGIILLTNSGDLARYLELPSTAWRRRYRVKVHGHIRENFLRKIDGQIIRTSTGVYGPISISSEKLGNANSWLNISICEGKNREIRNIMKHFGFEVSRLMRVSYGPFHIGSLRKGAVKEIRKTALINSLGKKWVDKL